MRRSFLHVLFPSAAAQRIWELKAARKVAPGSCHELGLPASAGLTARRPRAAPWPGPGTAEYRQAQR